MCEACFVYVLPSCLLMYRMMSSICAIQKYQVSICSARIQQPANMFLCCQTRKINPAKLTAFTAPEIEGLPPTTTTWWTHPR